MSHHVVVLGPGRCGTTAFVRLLHNLGYDTGFEDSVVNAPRVDTGGGLECPIRGSAIKTPTPYVVKSPALSDSLIERSEKWGWEIDHAYILVRGLDMMLKSKEERTGGSTPEASALRREKILRRVGASLLNCIEMKVPYTILEYPRWAVDPRYCCSHLHECHDESDVVAALEKTIDPRFLRSEEA